MLWMEEKCMRSRIWHSIYQYAKDKNKYMEDWIMDVNNFYGWKMPQKLSVNNFEWMKDTFQFNEYFVEKYIEECNGYFLKVDVQYLEKLLDLHNDLPF